MTAMSAGYGNPAYECDGALIRAHSRRLATVVSVDGAVHQRNFDRVARRVTRFVLVDSHFVLDLGGLFVVDAECRELVQAVDRACRAAGVEWALVAAEEVVEALDLADDDVTCAEARSVPEALRYFAEVTRSRRRILLPLLAKSA